MVDNTKPTSGTTRVEIFAVLCLIVFIFFLLVAAFIPNRYPHQGECADHLRRISLALAQYASDNDGLLPPPVSTGAGGQPISWRACLDPYLAWPLGCPSNASHELSDLEYDGQTRSYALNQTIFGLDRHLLISTPGASTSIAVVESTAAYATFDVTDPARFAQPTSRKTNGGHLFVHTIRAPDYGPKPTSRPEPSANFLFLDGHLRAIDPLDTIGRGGNLWTTDQQAFPAPLASTTSTVLNYGRRASASDDLDSTGPVAMSAVVRKWSDPLFLPLFFASPALFLVCLFAALRRSRRLGIAFLAAYFGLYVVLSTQGRYIGANYGGDDNETVWAPALLVERELGIRWHEGPTLAGIVYMPLVEIDRRVWHRSRDMYGRNWN